MGYIYLALMAVLIVATVLAVLNSRREHQRFRREQKEYEEALAARNDGDGYTRVGGRIVGMATRPEKPLDPKGSPLAAALAGLGLMALVSLLFSVSFIGSRTIGIQKQFGIYVSTMGSGPHLVRPWSDVERFPLTLQPLDLVDADEYDGDTKPSVPLSFAGAGRGWGEFTPRWGIKDDTTSTGAKALWEKYRDYDNVRDNLVYPTARDTFRNVASAYAPVDALAKQQEISDKVRDGMNAKLDRYGIVVDSVSITGLPLDPQTQQSLDRINVSAANVKNAENERQRAIKDAQTAKIREESGILSPQGNLRYCLDVMNAWNVEKNGPLPAGFSCFGSAGAVPTLTLNK